LPLPENEVHVWYARCERWPDDGHLGAYQAILSSGEQARQRRFAFPEHRRQFLISHALLRLALSQYTEVDPAAWQFVNSAHGKPALAEAGSVPYLRFNLSHTRGLAAVAVALRQDVGVDAENIERRDPGIDLARRYFAAEEVAHLSQLEGEQRKSTFFDFWTLKEAYIKARGLGLALPLDQFWFQLSPGGPPQIAFSKHLQDQAADWQFTQFHVAPRWRLALAIHRPGRSDRVVVLRESVPSGRLQRG
jgi:4'-phosphopantetheinyl transferase